MTFTVLGHCPQTGRLGIGIATFSITVGLYCNNGVKSRTGVTISQAFPNQYNNALVMRLLEQGFAPDAVMAQLAANDPDHAYRQIGIIDRDGRTAAHSGPKTRGWSGHKTGPGWIACGNGLIGPQIVEAIGDGFMAEPDADLEHRLLTGLEAGRAAGGQGTPERRKTERSAALVVHGRHIYSDIDLRVDLHDSAIEELRRVWHEYKEYEGFYRERSRNPRSAVPQEVFAARLQPAEGAAP